MEKMSEARVEMIAEDIARAGKPALLFGPPGSGKIMIARRVVKYLPPIGHPQEAFEIAWIYMSANLVPPGVNPDPSAVRRGEMQRPFRAPHHSVSLAGMVGTKRYPVGELGLAHGGVLFLDELPEFNERVIEAVSRAMDTGLVPGQPAFVPARFLLVASANPCLCGWHRREERACVCSGEAVQRYRARLERYRRALGLTPVPIPIVGWR